MYFSNCSTFICHGLSSHCSVTFLSTHAINKWSIYYFFKKKISEMFYLSSDSLNFSKWFLLWSHRLKQISNKNETYPQPFEGVFLVYCIYLDSVIIKGCLSVKYYQVIYLPTSKHSYLFLFILLETQHLQCLPGSFLLFAAIYRPKGELCHYVFTLLPWIISHKNQVQLDQDLDFLQLICFCHVLHWAQLTHSENRTKIISTPLYFFKYCISLS